MVTVARVHKKYVILRLGCIWARRPARNPPREIRNMRFGTLKMQPGALKTDLNPKIGQRGVPALSCCDVAFMLMNGVSCSPTLPKKNTCRNQKKRSEKSDRHLIQQQKHEGGGLSVALPKWREFEFSGAPLPNLGAWIERTR